MSWFKICVVIVVIVSPNLIFNGTVVSAQIDPIEGSGEVCDIEASSCPDDKCCSKRKCDEEGKTVKCCPDQVDFAHWIVNEGFRYSISKFVEEEKKAICKGIEGFKPHSPYRGK